MKDTLYCFVGKSGSGKNYIQNMFDLKLIPSYTTRPMRAGEVDGREHIFMPIFDQEFWWENYFRDNKSKIIAWTKFNNYYYWTITDDLNNPEYNCTILDPAGVYELFRHSALIKRDIKVIYFNVSLFKRIKYMLKRKDKIMNIISRIRHDEKIFNDFFISNKNDIIELKL